MKVLLVSESHSMRHEIENLMRDLQKTSTYELKVVGGVDLLDNMHVEDYDVLVFERRVWQRHCSMYRYFLGVHTFDRMSLVFLHRGKKGENPKTRSGRKDIHLVVPATSDQLERAIADSRLHREQLENAARFAQV